MLRSFLSLFPDFCRQMFDRLKKKWKVNEWQLALILCTFAIGGSVTGYLGKIIMNALGIGQDWLWAIVYFLLITIIWPVAVILISIPFGQFRFFSQYLKKIGGRMGFTTNSIKPAFSESLSEAPVFQKNTFFPEVNRDKIIHIAIFASGTGSNAQRIIDFFRRSSKIKVALIVCNKPGAGVLQIAQQEGLAVLLVEKDKFSENDIYINELKELQIDFIVLAGFLWKLPVSLIKAYPNRIVNIHPALLPKYGGKGMYGRFVHQSVIDNKEKESGITIHYVDEFYDRGKTIFQVKCPVLESDTANSLAKRIQKLEHEYYPAIIDQLFK
ncbi:MAG: phosphoribosylglycinamide formyltransferase [Chitinophagaceae bacterium]